VQLAVAASTSTSKEKAVHPYGLSKLSMSFLSFDDYDGMLKSKRPADVFSLRTLFICLSSALRLWRACFTTVFLDIK